MGKNLDISLDSVLIQLGEFGRFQIFMIGLVCFAVILNSATNVAYVFTAMDLDYRCKVPECDLINPPFEPPWLPHAVPYTGSHPSKCFRFKPDNETITPACNSSQFFSQKQKCETFVYKTEDYTILREYDLHCDENLWKLTLVGTINNVGQFFGLFVSGMISDRFGRKIALVLGMVLCGTAGLLRTLAPSYSWFLVFEFLDAAFGAGIYACGFIMGVELVGPKNRVLIGTMVSSTYAIGEVFAAGSAYLVRDWRKVIYILYSPPLLILIYLWIIPESIRWSLSKGRCEEATTTLRRAAKVNGTIIAEEDLERLTVGDKTSEERHSFFEIFRSPVLACRFVNCCFCWITCAFLFYGLILNSVALAGNSYLDFIYTALVEIPAYFLCNYAVNKFGRKLSLSGSFFLTGASCIAFIFLPKDLYYASLSAYLLGKFGATAAFTITYLLTSELFPTPLRHSMMGACSTFGRIGSMVSPQTPLLAQIWEPLPIVLFAAMALAAGVMSLGFPETVDVRLPDTIEEAVNVGKGKNYMEIH